jgi:hypothetical protein
MGPIAMTVTSVAIAVLGAATALNLLLTLAVIRRLGDLRSAQRSQHDPGLPAPGTPIGVFDTVDVSGATLSHHDVASGESRVVFLMSGCGPCADVRAALRRLAPESGRLLVFVAADPMNPETTEILESLPRWARVALTPTAGGPVAAAFHVSAFPAVLKIKDGAVALAATRLAVGQPPSVRVPA